MSQSLRLLAVLAHPDDESLGFGGTLAHYAAEGVETFLVTATRGERGRFFDNEDRPADEEVGRVREAELRDAARELGIREVTLLDYRDQELADADATEVLGAIVAALRRIRPHVVITFGHDGAYGHPDHIAIAQFTAAAVMLAADPTFAPARAAAGAPAPHRVAKLYWNGWPAQLWELYESVFKRLVSVVDGVERHVAPWPDWALTTHIEAGAQWQRVWRAVQCHRTQLAIYGQLDELTPEQHRRMWGEQYFYRVASSVNGGRARETDLFAGLR